MRESGEMYLETIFVLSKKSDDVHAVDVSEYMGYSKPSVSRAMGILKERGMITIDPSGRILLTEEGRSIAENIYDRHKTLTELLVMVGVDEKTAADDACKIEHYISETTFRAVKKRMDQHKQENWYTKER
ncbi:MAG: metal-dependent transcriptional regulator [Lachnospiraceae bacterium]|nr:metal-dependent transcriptional regulator [Lachnospiraceae bacterium]MBR5738736.1 metal-dependent transcriptional regulator [Lachnospiraceae bacterium]